MKILNLTDEELDILQDNILSLIEDEEDIDTEIDATVNTNYLADNID